MSEAISPQRMNEGDGPEHQGLGPTEPIRTELVEEFDAGVLLAGTTLLTDVMNKLLSALSSVGNRAAAIGIDNYTNINLIDPEQYLYSGQMYKPPAPEIQGGKADACCFTKTSGAARGTVGVLTYVLQGRGQKLAILWSVPYDYGSYSIWYDVQVISQSKPTNYDLYSDMYYGDPMVAGTNISKVSNGFKLNAACGTVSDCMIRVSINP